MGRPRLFGSARGDSPPHTSPYSLPPFLSPSFLVHLRHLYIFVIPSSDGPGPSILSFHILHTHPRYSLSLLHCVQGFLAPVIDYTLLANVFALFRLSSGKRRRRYRRIYTILVTLRRIKQTVKLHRRDYTPFRDLQQPTPHTHSSRTSVGTSQRLASNWY